MNTEPPLDYEHEDKQLVAAVNQILDLLKTRPDYEPGLAVRLGYLTAIARQWKKLYPQSNVDPGAIIVAFEEYLTWAGIKQAEEGHARKHERNEPCPVCDGLNVEGPGLSPKYSLWVMRCPDCKHVAISSDAEDVVKQWTKIKKQEDGEPRVWIQGHPIAIADPTVLKPDIILCARVANRPPPPRPYTIAKCCDCDQDVYRDETSLPAAAKTEILCMECIVLRGEQHSEST